MNVVVQTPWTVERFLDWVGREEARYEFDGTEPVAMVGGTVRHSRITVNIHLALGPRLRGTAFAAFGPDLAVRTAGNTIRFPDVLIASEKSADSDRLAPGPVVVFEVLSPESGRRDRIEKVREYAAVPSILRYVIVETTGTGLQVLYRQTARDAWCVLPLTGEDVLGLPEVGIEVPVAEIYAGVDFGA